MAKEITYEKDMEEFEDQKQNVDDLLKNCGIDYSIDTLKSISKAADILFEIYNCESRVEDIANAGLDAISLSRTALSFMDHAIEYKELEQRGASEAELQLESARLFADCMSAFGTISGRIPVLKNVSYVFTYGAEALSSGAAIIQSRLTYLEQLDRELDEALGWNDVADDSGVLIETYEDQVHFRNALNKLKSARSELQSADIYDGSLDSVISDIESKLNALDQKANDVINKVENKSGYLASNLSDLANHATSEKNNSNGGDWTDTTTDETSDDANDRYGDSGKTPAPRDPLIIDLGKKGIELTNVENGVHFDIDKNGFAEKTAWTDGEDGFLVLDRNGNGFIDDGGELFSDQVVMKNGEISKDGFEALADLDDNKDGTINIEDAQFSDLRVWIDSNMDGISSDEELKTLEELGITSISLRTNDPNTNTDETEFIMTSSVTFKNGDIRDIQEHWFEVKTHDTEERDDEGQKLIIDSVEAFGNVTNLSSAIISDETGELASLVENFKTSSDPVEKRILIKKILYFLTNSNTILPSSRGGVIDARDLHVVEQFMGQDFVGAEGTSTPNSNAAKILKDVYFKIENMYLNLLNQETEVQNYLNMIYENVTDNGVHDLDTTIFVAKVLSDIRHGKVMNYIIYGVESWLYEYDKAYGTSILSRVQKALGTEEINTDYITNAITAETIIANDMINSSCGTNKNEIILASDNGFTVNASGGNDIIYGGTGNDTINAGSGDDVVYGDEGNDTITGDSGNDKLFGGNGDDSLYGGTGSDILYGENGNDILNGGADNDILYGGEGNDSISGGTGDDMLYGGAGDDTYYIDVEHGNDVIYDSEGQNTLIFGNELSADDYSLHIDINNGISLVNTETGETISVPDFINMPESYEFIFEGESQIIGGGDSRQIIEGTDEDDTITGGNGFNIIRGNGGNDIITGGDNLNFIYGGDGDDTITGGNGTNIIRGENGNDVIHDGSGDSYLDGGEGDDKIYGGDGNDIIIGGDGSDELHGENGDDIIAGNAGNDTLYGEDGNDTLYADAGDDELHGGNGNDSLFGGDGDDILYGDDGDDYLEAGNGTDTLYGGIGNDTFVGGEGINYMYGEDGDDTFYGGNALNYMYGGDGDDNFTGGELADYIEGGSGNDTMNGGNGNNEMYGGDGDDYIYGGNDDDYIEGENGDDHLYGGNGVNTIYGGAGNDIIYSGENGSFLYGGDGDDQIFAGGGADILDGGAGNDYLQGDHGGDTYIFGFGYDMDTINASSDLNKIIIHGYTTADMHNTRMANNDLMIDFGENTGDRLIIQGFFNFNSNCDFNFIFDDGTVLGQYDIQAISAPIYGTDADEWLSVQGNDSGIIHAGGGNDGLSGGSGNDELYGEDGDDALYGNDGNDILDGGTGNDSLNGGNGEDTYIFAKGYAQDTINEWGSDHSIVELTDINSDEITVSDQYGSNLIISVNGTDDVLTISNFKWGQSTFTFRFADGAEGYVDKETWQFVLTKQPDLIEEDIEQMGAELLESLYEDDAFLSDFLTEDSTVIDDVIESAPLNEKNDDIADMTDIQAMLLAENMSAFGDDSQISDSVDMTDMTADTFMTDSLLVGSLQ